MFCMDWGVFLTTLHTPHSLQSLPLSTLLFFAVDKNYQSIAYCMPAFFLYFLPVDIKKRMRRTEEPITYK